MQVTFHTNGYKISGAEDSQKEEIHKILSQQLENGSEFTKNQGFDAPGLNEFKNHLSENNIRLEGKNSEDIIQALEGEAGKFFSFSSELFRFGKGVAQVALPVGAALISANLLKGNITPDIEEKNYALQIINQSSSAPKIFFPEKLSELSLEDRINPQRIRKALGNNIIRQDTKGEYFSIISRSSNEKVPSVEKYHLNNPEELKEAFRIIDAEKTRRENSSSKSV